MVRIIEILNKNSLYVKNLFFTYFSQAITAISLLILTPLLNKGLGIELFGIYGVLLNLIAFFVIFDFGFNAGLLRKYILNSNESHNLINSLFVFFGILLIFVFPIIYLILFHSTSLFISTIINYSLLISIIIIQNILILLLETILQSYNLIFISKVARSLKLILELILTIILLKRISINILLYISILTNLILLGSLYIYLSTKQNFKLKLLQFSFRSIAQHFKYSIWYFLNSLASVLVFNSQIVVINYLVGSAIAAKFLILTRFFDIIRIALTNFTQILTPQIIYIEQSNDWNRIKDLFIKVIKRVSFLSIFITFLIYFFGRFIFLKWSKLYDVEINSMFNLYIFFILIIVIDNVTYIFLTSLKMNKNTTIVSVMQGILNLGLTYILVKRFGIIGSIYASIASFMLTSMVYNPIYLLRKIDFKLTSINPN
jgi:O-antigen/teichoic acid export membrane protein